MTAIFYITLLINHDVLFADHKFTVFWNDCMIDGNPFKHYITEVTSLIDWLLIIQVVALFAFTIFLYFQFETNKWGFRRFVRFVVFWKIWKRFLRKNWSQILTQEVQGCGLKGNFDDRSFFWASWPLCSCGRHNPNRLPNTCTSLGTLSDSSSWMLLTPLKS